MSRRRALLPRVRDCVDVHISAGRCPAQLGWYRFAAGLVAGKRVLGVGSGMGAELEVLKSGAAVAHGLEVDPRLGSPDVIIGDISEVPGNAYDVVVCIDVLEHVADDHVFLRDLFRVARELVLVTTPNWSASRSWNEYHRREYTPRGFRRLLTGHSVRLFKGDEDGTTVSEETRPSWYDALNDVYNSRLTRWPAKAANRVLGFIWPHQAALVMLKPQPALPCHRPDGACGASLSVDAREGHGSARGAEGVGPCLNQTKGAWKP